MYLTDNNFNNLATGDVIDKLINEWGGETTSGRTDPEGMLRVMLFHGDYEVSIDGRNVGVHSIRADRSGEK
ncbi:hypothetical protein MLD38_026957 [Melastoma candidum]|uniref:Uncharacterized protein n=1 Tax=Melastoma candidum TaxID=119954 RepID=A0ACB9P350_9MYRT|nr:hypothetical protein MLD38_026957 [Melastoma candidum]